MPAGDQVWMLNQLHDSLADDNTVHHDINRDESDCNANGFIEALEEDSTEETNQYEGDWYGPVLHPVWHHRVFDDVRCGIRRRERDRDDKPCRGKANQREHKELAIPIGQQPSQHRDGAIPMRARLCYPLVHRKRTEQG